MASILDWALNYAAHGWAVIPLHTASNGLCSCGQPGCHSPAKHPRTENGVKDATKLPDLIKSWWMRWPDANIGIACGAVSGVVVVDIDGPEGEKALVEMCGNPPCPTSLTAKGRHAFFSYPGYPVKNAVRLAAEIDIRADGGYVVAPPSVHASGARYKWDVGFAPKDVPPPPIPEALIERLESAPDRAPAAQIAEGEAIIEGGRNQSLARYTGRLLHKGHSPAEVLTLVHGLNQRACNPPLSDKEVDGIVRSIVSREDPDPEPEHMADKQVREAIEFGRMDFSKAPRWNWPCLRKLCGPILPGELWIIGARPSQGKTTFLLNWAEHLAEMQGVPWLYIGMEMDPKQLRRKWSAFRCDLDEEAVLTADWTKLPDDAQQRIEDDLKDQAGRLRKLAHFAPARRINIDALKRWVGFAVDNGCKVVIVDHLHQMEFNGEDARQSMSKTVKEAKELAVENQIGLVMAAQLNRGARDMFEPYRIPVLSSLKECGTIEEAADGVLMLSRVLNKQVTKAEAAEVREGMVDIDKLVMSGAMRVTCRKHRRNGGVANDKSEILQIDNGMIRERIAIA